MSIDPLALIKAVKHSASELLLLAEHNSTTITGPSFCLRSSSSLFAIVAQIASLNVPDGVRQRRFPNISLEEVLQFSTGWHGVTLNANCMPASKLLGSMPGIVILW